MRKSKLLIIIPMIILLMFTLWACNPKGTDSYTYTVSFNTDGGTQIDDFVITKDTTFALPDNPTKEGFTFDNWYLDSDLTIELNIANILELFDEDTTEITVYAKWLPVDENVDDDEDEEDDEEEDEEEDFEALHNQAKGAVVDSLEVYYVSTVGLNYAPLTADEETEKAALEDSLAVVGENNSQKLDYIQTLIDRDDEYQSYYFDCYEFLRMMEDIDTFEGWDTSTQEYFFDILFSLGFLEPDFITFINTYEEPEDFYTQIEDYSLQIEEVLSYRIVWENAEDEDFLTWDEVYRYQELLQIEEDYDEFLEWKDDFIALFDAVLDEIGVDDIRYQKLNNLATFLTDYDYDEINLDRGDYYQLDSNKMFSFVIDIVESSEFTTDDLGIFFYNMIMNQLDKAIEEATEEETEDAADFATLKAQLSVDMITDYSELVYGLLTMMVDNGFIDSIAVLEEEAPTITEMATILASVKLTIEDFLAEYTATEVDALIGYISDIASAIATEKEQEEAFEPLLTIIDDIQLYADMEMLVEVLDIFDADALSAFFIREEVEENDPADPDDDETYYAITPNMENPYFFDNLVILEARLWTIAIGDSFNQTEFDASYEKYVDYFFTLFNFYGSMSPDAEEAELIMQFYLGNVVGDEILNNKIYMDADRYTEIQLVAALDFNQSDAETSNITELEYNAVPLSDAFFQVMEYQLEIETFVFDLLDDPENTEDDDAILAMIEEMGLGLPLGAALYYFDIELSRIQDLFSDYLDPTTGLDLTTAPQKIVANAIVILFEEGNFTIEEISDILTYAGNLASEFLGNEVYIAEISEIMELFVADSQLMEELMFAVVNLADLVSDFIFTELSFDELYDYEKEEDYWVPIFDGEAMQALVDVLESFRAIYYDVDELIYQQNTEKLCEALSNAFALMKTIYINDNIYGDEEDGIYDYDTEELLFTDAEHENMANIVYDIVVDLISTFGFDATINKLQAILDESVNLLEAESYEEKTLFYVKAFAIFMGENTPADLDDDYDFADLLIIAGSDNMIADILAIVDSYYEDFSAYFATSYEDILDDQDFLDLVTAFTDELFALFQDPLEAV